MADEPTSLDIKRAGQADVIAWVMRELARCEVAIANVRSSPAWTLYNASRKELLTGMFAALTQIVTDPVLLEQMKEVR